MEGYESHEIKQTNLYKVDIEYSPYRKDAYLVIYKKTKGIDNQGIDSLYKKIGYAYMMKYEFMQDKFEVVYDIWQRHSTEVSVPTYEGINEIFVTEKEEKDLIDEEVIMQLESYKVAYRLRNSK
jgi:hypothetical protein